MQQLSISSKNILTAGQLNFLISANIKKGQIGNLFIFLLFETSVQGLAPTYVCNVLLAEFMIEG